MTELDITAADSPSLRPPVPGDVRTSDGEREQVARILRAAAGEGLLTLSEADDRLAALYASRWRSELAPLTADLPDGGRRLLENTAEARHAARNGLRRHALTGAVIAAVLVGVWIVSDAEFFWPIWPLIFMTVSVFKHAQRIAGRA